MTAVADDEEYRLLKLSRVVTLGDEVSSTPSLIRF
jgi:hypothetical protein